jgi:hypothetical protein
VDEREKRGKKGFGQNQSPRKPLLKGGAFWAPFPVIARIYAIYWIHITK